jgi:mRNA interferase YafQ
MRRIETSSTFKKDLKRCSKRGLAFTKFDEVISLLIRDKVLPARNRPHKLSGEWRGFWECHIEPDWLLIYDLEHAGVLSLERMGTHADLFE